MFAMSRKAAIFVLDFPQIGLASVGCPVRIVTAKKTTGTGLGLPSKSNAAHPGSGLLFGALGDRCTSV